MTVQIKALPHTIFFIIGYPKCGATTFSKALVTSLNDYMLDKIGLDCTAAYISDESYKYILDPDVSADSPRYYELDRAVTFLSLEALNALTDFSVNKEFIVVDINYYVKDPKLLLNLIDFAKLKGYDIQFIVFDHDDHPKEDWIYSEKKKFKNNILANLPAEIRYRSKFINKLPAINWASELKVEIEGANLYGQCILSLQEDEVVGIIGDTHEHVDALERMCAELRTKWHDIILVLVGDYLDKGHQTEEMINFIEKFVNEGGVLVHGNHEYSNYRRIMLHRDGEKLPESDHFSASPILLENKELADRFIDIYENFSVPFLKIQGDKCNTMYVTHAPCKEKYIGKIHSKALKKQRNVAGDRTQDYRLSYQAVFYEADEGKPYHVFGHVSHGSKEIKYKNKIFLDTGAVYGYHLTSLIMNGKGEFHIHQFPTESLISRTLPDYLHKPIENSTTT